MLNIERRKELAAFLTTRRARITPLTAGFPESGTRRTPGLRREEVALLAGIGVTWYTWLEQARDINISTDAAARIAKALRLNPQETRHLYILAGLHPPAAMDAQQKEVVPRLLALLEHMPDIPAYYLDDRWNILAWNRAAAMVFNDFSQASGLERNVIWLMFHYPPSKTLFTDWSYHARGLVCRLRAHYAARMNDPWLTELIETLKRSSLEFSTWWSEHDIHGMFPVEKELDHPTLGKLFLEFQAMDVSDTPDIRLALHIPKKGTDTLQKIRNALAEYAE